MKITVIIRNVGEMALHKPEIGYYYYTSDEVGNKIFADSSHGWYLPYMFLLNREIFILLGWFLEKNKSLCTSTSELFINLGWKHEDNRPLESIGFILKVKE